MNLPLTIKETQEGLLKKDYSAYDLVNGYLARIKKYDGKLNSFNTVSDKSAYKQAKEVDKRIKNDGKNAFDKYPLLGVVVAHKDLFLTKGITTTASSNVLKDYIPQYSATVVIKLEKAGCITIGKTNSDAWAHGASGENSDFGPTKNPWNTKCVPGGSSSGSAVSIAADFSLISTGTDTGGSIRQPANFCSITGLKPTYGATSRYGVIAMASSFDSVGHFSRTVEDSRIIFNVIKGKDEKDSTLNERASIFRKAIKIGIPKQYFLKGLDSEIKKGVSDVIKYYENKGVEFVSINLPHTKYAISVYYIIQPAEVSSNLGRYDGVRYGSKRDTFSAEAKRRIMLGTYVLSSGYYEAYYLKAQKVRSNIIEDFDSAFKKVDAIIAPVSPTPPFAIGEKSDDPLKMYLADILTAPANVAGIPGMALPCGFDRRGLPMGFQLMGPRFSEDLLFNLGELFQKETSWHVKKPNI